MSDRVKRLPPGEYRIVRELSPLERTWAARDLDRAVVGRARGLLLLFLAYANATGDLFASQRQLASELGCKPDRVAALVRVLEATELVAIKPGSRRKATGYHVYFDRLLRRLVDSPLGPPEWLASEKESSETGEKRVPNIRVSRSGTHSNPASVPIGDTLSVPIRGMHEGSREGPSDPRDPPPGGGTSSGPRDGKSRGNDPVGDDPEKPIRKVDLPSRLHHLQSTEEAPPW